MASLQFVIVICHGHLALFEHRFGIVVWQPFEQAATKNNNNNNNKGQQQGDKWYSTRGQQQGKTTTRGANKGRQATAIIAIIAIIAAKQHNEETETLGLPTQSTQPGVGDFNHFRQTHQESKSSKCERSDDKEKRALPLLSQVLLHCSIGVVW